MGINRLWPLLEITAEDKWTLSQLTLKEGFERQPQWGVYRLGVDASIWIEQCSRAYHARFVRGGRSPELSILFKRLASLLAACVQPIFVFDGKQRPAVKRGKQVIFSDNWMVEDFKKMVEVFGFCHHTAPGEAEAELAHMNELGIIDGVLTDDSDVFVFGARTVIRNNTVTFKSNKDPIQVYRLSAIESHKEVGLNRAGLVLVALLCGGDYDKGIPGCGVGIASGIAHYGLGDTLWHAARNLSPDDLQLFLCSWRRELQDCFRKDPSGYVGNRHPKLAAAVTTAFPNMDALRYYTRPVVTDFEPTYHIPLPRFPRVPDLVRYCELEDIFSAKVGIVAKFKELLWPGFVLRELLEQAFATANGLSLLPSSGLLTINIQNFGSEAKAAKLRVASRGLDAVIEHSLLGLREDDTRRYFVPDTGARWRLVEVPSAVLRNARPNHAAVVEAAAENSILRAMRSD